MAAVVAARDLAAQQQAEALGGAAGIVHGDLDAVATVEHGPTLPQ